LLQLRGEYVSDLDVAIAKRILLLLIDVDWHDRPSLFAQQGLQRRRQRGNPAAFRLAPEVKAAELIHPWPRADDEPCNAFVQLVHHHVTKRIPVRSRPD